MTWSYRIVKTTIEGETRYGIHEVYYETTDDENELPRRKRPPISVVEKRGMGWTEAPIPATVTFEHEDLEVHGHAGAVKVLRDELASMLKACDMPIVDGDSENGLPVIEARAPQP